MILTTTKQLQRYASLHPAFSAAFTALSELARGEFERGRHPVDDEIFINALEYETCLPKGALMEAHKVYIDIMWMLSGEEEICVCPLDQAGEVVQFYNETADAMLSQMPANYTVVKMRPGSVCILFPEDAHAPGICAEGVAQVRKLIAKVRVK